MKTRNMNKNSNQEPIRTEGTNLGILLSSLLNDDSKEIRLEITCKVVDRGGTEAAAVSERTAKSKEEIPGVPRPLCREGRIDGIAALASFLSCAPSTAQRMKNEGAVPYYQRGVRIFFYEDEVLEALANAPRRSCREKGSVAEQGRFATRFSPRTA